MAELVHARIPAAQAASYAAEHFADSQAPVIIAEDRNRGASILKHLHQKRCGRNARVILPSALAEAANTSADPNAAIPTAEMLALPAHFRAVRTTRLQADIHSYLADAKSTFAGLGSARTIASTLVELENYAVGAGNPFAKIDDPGAYAEELEFLSQLWETHTAEQQTTRRERMLNLARQATSRAIYIYSRQPLPIYLEFMQIWAQQQPAALVEIDLEEPAHELDRLWSLPSSKKIPSQVAKPVLHGLETIEDASRVAVSNISRWLNDGLERIGIIAYDRTLVRRVNSECIANGIHPNDITGWTANTMLVGDCLLAAAESCFASDSSSYSNALMQALSAQSNRKAWAHAVRARQSSRESDLDEDFALLQGQRLPRHPQQWLLAIADLTTKQPICEFFDNDYAAMQVIEHIRHLACEFEDFEGKLSHSEMLSLLQDSLARLHVASARAQSPVHIVEHTTSLVEKFDALIMLGPDATTLPHVPVDFAFNDTLRSKLGLPTREDAIALMRKSTARMLAAHAGCECIAIWCNPHPSPYLSLLNPAHEKPLALRPPWLEADTGSDAQSSRAARLPAGTKPAKLSPSGSDTLMDCPYKFFANKLLQANENDTLGLFNPAEYGSIVHEIVEKFHEQTIAKQPPTAESLRKITDEVIAAFELDDDRKQLIKWRWLPLIEKYAHQIQQRLKSGWKILAAEKELEADLIEGIRLGGTLDLLEENEQGDLAVIDVKTGNKNGKDVTSGEKPQLMLYAHLAQAQAEHSFLRTVRISNGIPTVKDLLPKEDSLDASLARKTFERLQMQARQMFEESRDLPANGHRSVCQFCDCSGLCRRPHWRRKQ